MKIILLYLILLFSTIKSFSQTCEVGLEALKGQYDGGCRKGKANGKGIATGIDTYTGYFKNGLPDGEGKYSWKNGDWYEGSWKDGLFSGKGTFSKAYHAPDSSSIVTGFWEKGKYAGRYEKPYNVQVFTNNISDINVRKINKISPEIVINVKNITGGASNLTYTELPKSRLINIETIQGRFQQQVADETSSKIANIYTLRQVTFPFYAIFSFETTGTKMQTEKVGIEILENANWDIQVSIDN